MQEEESQLIGQSMYVELDSGLEESGTAKFGIVVYPQPQEEVFRLVSDICASLFTIRDGKESESRVPEEVEKVLRSMADLPRRPSKEHEGELDDPLQELAKTFDTPEKLTAEFQARMKLSDRTETGLWSDATSEQEGLVWLRDEFRRVNNGRNPKISLAKRIDVFVPRPLIPECIYELTGVDTKDVPIIFYDAAEESPVDVRKKLLKKIDGIRTIQATRLNELTSATEDLVSKFQDQRVKNGYAKLRSEMQIFVDRYHQLPPQAIKAQDRIVSAFNHRHARTVWASARRNGDWDNLNSYQIVAIAANEDAEARSKAALAALDKIFDTLSKDPDCAAIKSHITVLQSNIVAWKLNFLKKVTGRSQEIYRAVLYPDNLLWDACEAEWKVGKGFRDRVAGEVEKWLQDNKHEWIHDAVDAIIRAEWQDLFIGPIQTQCQELAAP